MFLVDCITVLEELVLAGMPNVQSISIPATVTNAKRGAFKETYFKDRIEFIGSVYIENGAFDGMSVVPEKIFFLSKVTFENIDYFINRFKEEHTIVYLTLENKELLKRLTSVQEFYNRVFFVSIAGKQIDPKRFIDQNGLVCKVEDRQITILYYKTPFEYSEYNKVYSINEDTGEIEQNTVDSENTLLINEFENSRVLYLPSYIYYLGELVPVVDICENAFIDNQYLSFVYVDTSLISSCFVNTNTQLFVSDSSHITSNNCGVFVYPIINTREYTDGYSKFTLDSENKTASYCGFVQNPKEDYRIPSFIKKIGEQWDSHSNCYNVVEWKEVNNE